MLERFRSVLPTCALALILTACVPSRDRAIPVVELSSVHDLARFDGWGEIRDVLPLDSTTVVLGSFAPFVHVLRDDTVAGAWGEQGDGPRELRFPARLVRTADGGAMVWDVGKRELFALTDSGLSEGVPLTPSRRGMTVADVEQITFGAPFRIRRAGARWVTASYSPGITSQDGYWHGSIVSLAAGAEPHEREIVRLDSAFGAPPPRGTQLAEVPLWDLCPDGVAVFDPHTGRVRVFALDGTEIGAGAPRPPHVASRPVTNHDLRVLLRRLVAAEIQATRPGRTPDSTAVAHMIESSLDRFRRSVAPTLPRAIGLRCTDRGIIWLREFDEASGDALGRGRSWLRYDGSWSRVLFPVGFTPLRFGRAGAWGLMRSKLDVQSPAYVPFDGSLSSESS